MKGREIHALVDAQALPLRVVIHSAGVQDRDGAALVLDKARNSFPWLEQLIWADSGYNAHRLGAAAAKVPSLRIEIVKRSDARKGFQERLSLCCRAAGSWREPFHGSVAIDVWPGTGGETSQLPLRAFVSPASLQIAIRGLAR